MRVCVRARLARSRSVSPFNVTDTFPLSPRPLRQPRPTHAPAPVIEPGAHQSAAPLPVRARLPSARRRPGLLPPLLQRPRRGAPASPLDGSARREVNSALYPSAVQGLWAPLACCSRCRARDAGLCIYHHRHATPAGSGQLWDFGSLPWDFLQKASHLLSTGPPFAAILTVASSSSRFLKNEGFLQPPCYP